MQAANNAPQSVQVNPIDVARNALQFLSRVTFTRAERQAFDQCEGMLAAISEGQVVLQQAPPLQSQSVPLLTESPQKVRRPRKLNGHGNIDRPRENDQQNPLI